MLLAQTEFDKSYAYFFGGFNSFSECPAGACTRHFTTGMGAFLQSVVNGWCVSIGLVFKNVCLRQSAVVIRFNRRCGVRFVPDGGMTLTPIFPVDGSTMNLTVAGIHFRRSSLTLSILPAEAHLSLAAGEPLAVGWLTPEGVRERHVLGPVPIRAALGRLITLIPA